MKDTMKRHSVENAEIEKLKNLLKQRLIDSGWRDEMKALCRDIVQKRGVDNITIDELVEKITKEGREKIDNNVKREMLYHITAVLKSNE